MGLEEFKNLCKNANREETLKELELDLALMDLGNKRLLESIDVGYVTRLEVSREEGILTESEINEYKIKYFDKVSYLIKYGKVK